MSLTLSIFDLFAYAIPGSLYLTLCAYVTMRLGWLSPASISSFNTTLLLIGAALASYLLGHLSYELGRLVERVLPGSRKMLSNGRRRFLEHADGPRADSVVKYDPFLLLAMLQIHAREAAVEVSRFRAGALMLRNSVPPLVLALSVALAEVIEGSNRPLAGGSVVLFLAGALSALRLSREQGEWAIEKTFQISYWLSELDGRTEPEVILPAHEREEPGNAQPRKNRRRWPGTRWLPW
jgi:hypothetical protein